MEMYLEELKEKQLKLKEKEDAIQKDIVGAKRDLENLTAQGHSSQKQFFEAKLTQLQKERDNHQKLINKLRDQKNNLENKAESLTEEI